MGRSGDRKQEIFLVLPNNIIDLLHKTHLVHLAVQMFSVYDQGCTSWLQAERTLNSQESRTSPIVVEQLLEVTVVDMRRAVAYQFVVEGS